MNTTLACGQEAMLYRSALCKKCSITRMNEDLFGNDVQYILCWSPFRRRAFQWSFHFTGTYASAQALTADGVSTPTSVNRSVNSSGGV